MLHNVPSEINLKKYRNSFHNNCTIIKIAMIQYIHKKIEEKKFTDHHNTSVKNVHTDERGRPNGTTHLTFNLIQEETKLKKKVVK